MPAPSPSPTATADLVADLAASVPAWAASSPLAELDPGIDRAACVTRCDQGCDVEWGHGRFGFHLWCWADMTVVSARFEQYSIDELHRDHSTGWIRELGPGQAETAVGMACGILAGCALYVPRLVHPLVAAGGRCGSCCNAGTVERVAPRSTHHARLHRLGVPEVLTCRACGGTWMAPHRDDPDLELVGITPPRPPVRARRHGERRILR